MSAYATLTLSYMTLCINYSQVSPEHLSVELVSCVFDFIRYLMNAPNGRDMLCQLVEQLLISSGLWIKASGKVAGKMSLDTCTLPSGAKSPAVFLASKMFEVF